MTRSKRLLAAAGLIGLAAPLLVTATADAAPAIHSGTSAVTTATTVHAATVSSDARHVTIPSNYSYHPHRGPDIALHDYCTASPDKFYTFGADADFRGPCARHDMCIQYYQKRRSSCDSDLLARMKAECRYTYSHSWDPRHGACLSTAYVYWAVVRTKTFFS